MSKQIAKVNKIIKKYKSKLFLDKYDFTVTIMKEYVDKSGNVATIVPNSIYFFAGICVYQAAFEKEENLNEIILHEMIHCIVDPVHRCATDLLEGKFRNKQDIEEKVEQLTETLTKIVK